MERGAGGTRITAASREALRAGARPGQALTDARAACPGLRVLQAEPEADRALLEHLARAAQRHAPIVAMDGPDGLLLDTTGCAHLFGGEAGLMADCTGRLERAGFTLRAGLAPTPGLARALALCGTGREIVTAEQAAARADALPVAALRLAPERVVLLRRLGLASVGALRALPRATLERRFRNRDAALSVRLRLDQLTGAVDEPLAPLQPPPLYRVQQVLPEPVIDVSAAGMVLGDLLLRLVGLLERDGRGARALTLTAFRADGGTSAVRLRLARPSRDAARIGRLFADRLEEIDSGFGIDAFLLEAPVAEALSARQDSLVEDLAPAPDARQARRNAGAGRAPEPPADSRPPSRAGAERHPPEQAGDLFAARTGGVEEADPLAPRAAVRAGGGMPRGAGHPRRLSHALGAGRGAHLSTAEAGPCHMLAVDGAEDIVGFAQSGGEAGRRPAQGRDTEPGAGLATAGGGERGFGFGQAGGEVRGVHLARSGGVEGRRPAQGRDTEPGAGLAAAGGGERGFGSGQAGGTERGMPPVRGGGVEGWRPAQGRDTEPGAGLAPAGGGEGGIRPGQAGGAEEGGRLARRGGADGRRLAQVRGAGPDPAGKAEGGIRSGRMTGVEDSGPLVRTGGGPAPAEGAGHDLRSGQESGAEEAACPAARSGEEGGRSLVWSVGAGRSCALVGEDGDAHPGPAGAKPAAGSARRPGRGSAPGQGGAALPGAMFPLVDTLANRLGGRRVYQLAPVASHLPERAMRRVAVGGAQPRLATAARATPDTAPDTAAWPEAAPPRPLRLLPRPEPLEVTAALPDGPPLQFVWRRVRRVVVRAAGPERIAPEWWHPDARGTAVRDYYHVEDREGCQYWICRALAPGGPAAGRGAWYMHGLFA
ncbi:DNA polymerase Y family protein [Oceanicella sp. SM1341]|uniref:Y-family DNA polymerase n=1 Tax=Oceanicella sp. SM1341 TaxID=1548889 RepID=UPI001E3304E7|nr:DNA polymerase Y family protein [Oceanicella sp. SM1341]